jgi:small subunit ribosomal protein S2
MERNGIHIIDLYKTEARLNNAAEAMKKIAASGRKIMYVATKKQAKDIIAENAGSVNQPFITERWPGGMLTNFVTIRKAIKKMQSIDKMKEDGSFNTLSKRERLQIDRQRLKLERQLGSITDMTRLPAALFIVDINKEHIAVKEAKKLGIPTFAIVDTNSNPHEVDYAIPGNDDATKSISILVSTVTNAIKEGLEERKVEKNKASDAKLKKTVKKQEGEPALQEEKTEKKEKA